MHLKESLAGIALALIAVAFTIAVVDPNLNVLGRSDQVRFVQPIRYDPLGHDLLHLNDEVVTLENPAEEPVDMSGWRLRNARWVQYRFPEGFVLGAEETVTIHSGCGEDTAHDLYWCSATPIWDDKQDEAVLMLPTGRRVSSYSYKEACKDCGQVIEF